MFARLLSLLPPDDRFLTIAMSLAVIGTCAISCAGIVGTHAERPECSEASLGAIEASYVEDLMHACEGQTFSACEARPAIEERYRARREDWIRCH